MKTLLILLCTVTCFVISCGNESQIHFYQHQANFGDSIIEKANPGDLPETPISLCEIFNYGWDSLVVVQPYSQFSDIKALNLDNLNSVSSDIMNSGSQDTFTTLLFIKNNKIFKHERVFNTPVNFNSLGDSTNAIPVIKGMNCDHLILKRIETKRVQKDYVLLINNEKSHK